ncbi:4944_t:CDS:10 [Acaulospora colombiana]|uniref:4944_t:CDS:1 n=1 Tax=Acaulospora colombiana TaxID=27376 RepID=A0ACA9JX71_9GLOM|nr:4944_t:CDS:10 [Acaulospora colombiana]
MATANNQEIRDKLEIMKETVDDEKILRDWETWMQEKTAILVRRNVRSTNLNLHKEINTLSLNKDESLAKNINLDINEEDQEDQEEEDINEIEEFFISKGNDDKVYNDGIGDDDSDDNFTERREENQLTTRRLWVLKSGTNVGDELAKYVKTIPEAHKCLNFKKDVKLDESDIPDVVEYFFDEVEKVTKKNDEHIINVIDGLTPEVIETNKNVKLTDEEKDIFAGLRRAVVTYAENLKNLEVPISEADFDNSFPNMLAKRFLDKRDLKMDVGEIACWASARRRNEGRSIILRARIGQKCDFRGTLKSCVNNIEAIIGLRSGGLPVAHRKKIHEDRVDLAVAMRDVLYNFFKTNTNAPGDDLHRTYVLGIQSWGWSYEIYDMDCKATNVLRLRRLSQNKMPNTLKKFALLEGFYATMSDVKSTLKTICDHTNNVSLSDSRLHRERKRKIPVQNKSFGSFGTPSPSPQKKGNTKSELDLLKQENATRINELEQIAKEKDELEVRIVELEQTIKLSQTENAELNNEIAKLKRAVKNIENQIRMDTNDLAPQGLLSQKSPEYSTPLSNKSCSNGENAQIKNSSTHHEADQSMTSTDLDQDLSLVNQDTSTESEKTITSSLSDAKSVTECHDLNNSDSSSEILESDNQIVEGLIQEITYDQAENIVSSEINPLYSNNDEDMAPGSVQSLSDLFDKAIKSDQKQILNWYYYSLEFENKINVEVSDLLISNSSDSKVFNVSVPPISKPKEDLPEAKTLSEKQPIPMLIFVTKHWSNIPIYFMNIVMKLDHEDGEGVEGNYKTGSYYIKCEASEIDMIQCIDRASSADAEIIV